MSFVAGRDRRRAHVCKTPPRESRRGRPSLRFFPDPPLVLKIAMVSIVEPLSMNRSRHPSRP